MERTSLRELMLLGAKGAGSGGVLSGTLTMPDAGTSYTLDFGKTFDRYFYIVEMTDISKTTLMATEYNANKVYAWVGTYPFPELDNVSTNDKSYMSCRVNPSTSAIVAVAGAVSSIDGTMILFPLDDIGNTTNALYRGYSYNYYIVEIK